MGFTDKVFVIWHDNYSAFCPAKWWSCNLVKFLKKIFKKLLTFSKTYRILNNVLSETEQNGVWLSLARAPGLGPGCRRFESCHPEFVLSRLRGEHTACFYFTLFFEMVCLLHDI